MAAPLLVSLLLAVALAAASPGPALAAQDQRTVFDPPGLTLVHASPQQRATMLDQIAASGADTVRLLVYWRAYAPAQQSSEKPAGFDASDPTDYPSGTFDALDASARGIPDRGMKGLPRPTAPAPTWARAGGGKGPHRPA